MDTYITQSSLTNMDNLMSCELNRKHCTACVGGVPSLSEEESHFFLKKLHPNWQIIENHHLVRSFTFKDFKAALDFTNRVGHIAEEEAHHPDIYLSWGKVEIKIWTHKVNGLTENDFILAAKYDQIKA